MTLLITLIAAITATIVWYNSSKARTLKCGILCYMYWGASLMWLVDAIAEYFEIGADYFSPAQTDMLNDLFLGLSAVTLGLVVWIAVILLTDPKGVVKSIITNSRKS